jgi:hypothetical protein
VALVLDHRRNTTPAPGGAAYSRPAQLYPLTDLAHIVGNLAYSLLATAIRAHKKYGDSKG